MLASQKNNQQMRGNRVKYSGKRADGRQANEHRGATENKEEINTVVKNEGGPAHEGKKNTEARGKKTGRQ